MDSAYVRVTACSVKRINDVGYIYWEYRGSEGAREVLSKNRIFFYKRMISAVKTVKVLSNRMSYRVLRGF